MGFLQAARHRAHAVGKLFARHAATAGRLGLAAAAVGAAAYHAHGTHSAREERSRQRYRDNAGNMDWITSQPEYREHSARPSEPWNPHANTGGPTPAFIVPVKYH